MLSMCPECGAPYDDETAYNGRPLSKERMIFERGFCTKACREKARDRRKAQRREWHRERVIREAS